MITASRRVATEGVKRVRMLRLCCWLSIVVSFTACGPGNIREEVDALGYRKEYTVDPETGVRQGVLREYDAAGVLVVEEHYLDGQLHGARRVYGGAAQLLAEESYAAGTYEGPYRAYHPDGYLEMTGNYHQGIMRGVWCRLFPDGKVRTATTYRNNDTDGPVRQWYPNGQPELSGTYAAEETFVGDLIRYDSTGKLERVLRCDAEGLCRTYWTPDSLVPIPVPLVDMQQPTLPD